MDINSTPLRERHEEITRLQETYHVYLKHRKISPVNRGWQMYIVTHCLFICIRSVSPCMYRMSNRKLFVRCTAASLPWCLARMTLDDIAYAHEFWYTTPVLHPLPNNIYSFNQIFSLNQICNPLITASPLLC